MLKRPRPQVEDFTVGWICALPVELAAAHAALDEEFEDIEQAAQYTLGRVGGHHVVIACLPAGRIGTVAAAIAAVDVKTTFPRLQIGLMVGIAGGVPSPTADVRLGDVAISQPHGCHSGCVQYDFGKTGQGGHQTRTGSLNSPPHSLLTAVAKMASKNSVTTIQAHLSAIVQRTSISRPPTHTDTLFDPSYHHIGGDECDHCLEDKIIQRVPRPTEDLRIHYGTIGSGNQVVKDGLTRDRLSRDHGGILCFEMEAAGLMNIFPCLVVRGICDYADAHKHKSWQPFAAAAAASCAKEVLSFVPSARKASGSLSDFRTPFFGSNALMSEPAQQRVDQVDLLTQDTVPDMQAGLDPSDLYTIAFLSDERKKRYLESLCFDQIEARHATIQAAHSSTCKWLLERSEYKDWLAPEKLPQHHGLFWIKGKPATGKSTMMKFVLASTKKDFPGSFILKFFFNARGGDLEKSTIGMYRSLLFQLLQAVSDLQDVFALVPPLTSDDKLSYVWKPTTLQTLFRHAVERLGQKSIICFIDALDECNEDEIREMVTFFQQLGQLAASHQIQFRACFSSRHYPYITIEHGIDLVLEDQHGHEEDIEKYVNSELRIGNSKLADDMKPEICQRSSGIFLWVVLVVQILKKESDRGRTHALRKRLDQLPNGLDELFDDILMRDGQNIDELVLCLQFLLFAGRPLEPEELYHAILIGVDPDSIASWHPAEVDEQTVQRFLLDCSKGLAEVTSTESKVVQFIHESVRDYLKGQGLARLRPDLACNLAGFSHETMRGCCQSYIRYFFTQREPFYEPFGPSLPTLRHTNITRKYPFLIYSTSNLIYHADAAEGLGIDQLDFVKNFPLDEWLTLNNTFTMSENYLYTRKVTPLYVFAHSSAPNLTRIELSRVKRMDIEGEYYRFPLIAAIVSGDERSTTALLKPDFGDWTDSIESQTAFTVQHKAAIQRILATKISSLSNHDILSHIVQTEGLKMLERILDATHDDLSPGEANRLLMIAIHTGSEAAIMMLLRTGKADPESWDGRYHQTPLLWAAMFGNHTVIKHLLDVNKVNLEAKTCHGRTALILAAQFHHLKVVKLLCDTGRINIETKDQYGRTAISWAAATGSESIVKVLFAAWKAQVATPEDQDSVRAMVRLGLNAKDLYGNTPLCQAIAIGAVGVVRILLSTGAVNPDMSNGEGKTPLQVARKKYMNEVVELLLTAKAALRPPTTLATLWTLCRYDDVELERWYAIAAQEDDTRSDMENCSRVQATTLQMVDVSENSGWTVPGRDYGTILDQ